MDELYFNIMANVYLMFYLISFCESDKIELFKFSKSIIEVTKKLYNRVTIYERGYDYRETLYYLLKFDKNRMKELQYANYEWNNTLVQMYKEKHRFVNVLINRKIADITAYMLCSKFFYNLIDYLMQNQLSPKNFTKPYVIFRFIYLNKIYIVDLHNNDNKILILQLQSDKEYPSDKNLHLIVKNSKELTVSCEFIEPRPLTENSQVVHIDESYGIAVSSISHPSEPKIISIKRAFHMLIFFMHAGMVGIWKNMPVLHIRTNSPKKIFDSFSFDEIHVSNAMDGCTLLNDVSKIPYTTLPTAIRRADELFKNDNTTLPATIRRADELSKNDNTTLPATIRRADELSKNDN